MNLNLLSWKVAFRQFGQGMKHRVCSTTLYMGQHRQRKMSRIEWACKYESTRKIKYFWVSHNANLSTLGRPRPAGPPASAAYVGQGRFFQQHSLGIWGKMPLLNTDPHRNGVGTKTGGLQSRFYPKTIIVTGEHHSCKKIFIFLDELYLFMLIIYTHMML